MPVATALRPDELHTACDPARLMWDDAVVPPAGEPALHERAAEALRFGLAMPRPGFNLFVVGEPGCDRDALIRQLVSELGEGAPLVDWCYVNNFADALKPNLLRLPAGQGTRLVADMQRFVGELGPAIAAAFESDDHRLRVESLQRETKEREETALRQLGRASLEEGLALVRTEQGFSFLPLKAPGETLSSEEFEQLPEERQQTLSALNAVYQEKLRGVFLQFPRWRRETQAAIKLASSAALQAAVGHLIEDLTAGYADLPEVIAFLRMVEADVVNTGESLRESQKSEGEVETLLYTGSLSVQRYLVNLLVDRGGQCGRALVFEDHPTFQNLFGRVEHLAHLGMLVSNFTLIRAGALHRAHGGVLVIDAARLLAQPYAWDGLKRALKAGEIRIESLGEQIGLSGTQQLLPEPMPLEVKVILLGDAAAYDLLCDLDPDFGDAFKLLADCDPDIARSPASERLLARLVAERASGDGARPLSASAAARLVEEASRRADDAGRLSTATQPLIDLVLEADHLAGPAARIIERTHLEAALAARIRRADRLRSAQLRAILDETLLIATEGSHIGQINGLAAVEVGGVSFAHPVRLTAAVFLGDGDLIDIEREVDLGGPLHSKGVMILSAFFSARYGRAVPPSFGASLVFEQSYSDIEGDSASLAELCALLSALGGLPIRQDLAVTGSVNQFGVIQPIGAVNEKIEGFFDLCQARGLTGGQGVLIPRANVRHLMLRADVREAVAAGLFAVHAVTHVDQAIELLTGVPAGEPDAQGAVPEGSVNYAVAAQLMEFALQKQDFAEQAHKFAKQSSGRSSKGRKKVEEG